MNFDVSAKNLMAETIQPQRNGSKGEILEDLESAGFSRRETLHEMRTLYDRTAEDTVKRQILSEVCKIHGLTKDDDKKEIPRIIINVLGENSRVAAMLCPTPEAA